MSIIRRFFRFWYLFYVSIGLLTAIIILFVLALFSLVLPNRTRGNFLYATSRMAARFLFWCWGIRVDRMVESPLSNQQAYIFVFNHISYLDALILLLAVGDRPFRGLGKEEMASIPIFGYLYRSTVIMVKRTDAIDRARSVDDLKSTLRDNISIALAPEGTFNMTGAPLLPFFDGAFRIALQTQTQVCPMLILDAYDRMHYGSVFSLKPGLLRIRLLSPIDPMINGEETTVEALKKRTYDIMHEKLIEFNASWIQPEHAR
ncbi:MAG: lysophospholipid acyltransferase family protein [Ferruginibacter sp.]